MTPEIVTLNAVYIALGLAVITTFQVIAMAGVTGWVTSRKDKRDAETRAQEKVQDAKTRAAEKAEDNRRQDEVANRVAAVAKQAADAAQLVVTTTAETRRRTDEVAKTAAAADERTQAQLNTIGIDTKKIHGLVNSNMTTAIENERKQTALTLAATLQVQALSEKFGLAHDPGVEKAVADARARIADLDVVLADRAVAQHAVDADAVTEER